MGAEELGGMPRNDAVRLMTRTPEGRHGRRAEEARVTVDALDATPARSRATCSSATPPASTGATGTCSHLLHRRLPCRLRRHRRVAQRRRDHRMDGVAHDACGHTLHRITNVAVVAGRADGARARCYVDALVMGADNLAGASATGYYDDELVERRAAGGSPAAASPRCSCSSSATGRPPEGPRDARRCPARRAARDPGDAPSRCPARTSSSSGRSAPPSARRTCTSWTTTARPRRRARRDGLRPGPRHRPRPRVRRRGRGARAGCRDGFPVGARVTAMPILLVDGGLTGRRSSASTPRPGQFRRAAGRRGADGPSRPDGAVPTPSRSSTPSRRRVLRPQLGDRTGRGRDRDRGRRHRPVRGGRAGPPGLERIVSDFNPSGASWPSSSGPTITDPAERSPSTSTGAGRRAMGPRTRRGVRVRGAPGLIEQIVDVLCDVDADLLRRRLVHRRHAGLHRGDAQGGDDPVRRRPHARRLVRHPRPHRRRDAWTRFPASASASDSTTSPPRSIAPGIRRPAEDHRPPSALNPTAHDGGGRPPIRPGATVGRHRRSR